MNKFSLTEDEISRAAGLLAKLEPGYLPEKLFIEINRLHVASTVVVVPLKRAKNGVEVLLIERGSDDPIWPNYWHLPGTMLRPSDKEGDYSDAFRRIFEDELQNIKTIGEPEHVKTAFTETRRGREHTPVYWIEVIDQPKEGRFFPINNLPARKIEHETAYIQEAARQSGL